MFYLTRLHIAILILLINVTGCTTNQKSSLQLKPKHFVSVIPKQGDSLPDLANLYLGDPFLAFRISEFNHIDKLVSGQPVVVPLQPAFPYGLRQSGLQKVPILSYHSFSWKDTNNMTVREKDFEAQMLYLKENGFHVIPLSRMLELYKGGELPMKSVAITIDDGWGSAYRIAYPILRKYDYPYTIFLQTDLVNDAFKTLDWKQILEMLENSRLSIGSHTKTHRDLAKQGNREKFKTYFSAVKQELMLSKKIILKETGIEPTYLAYPYGHTSQLVIDLAKDAGYDAGFTILRDSNSILTDLFKLNRSMIYGNYTLEQFKDQLDTFQSYDGTSKTFENDIVLAKPTEATAQNFEDKKYWLSALNQWRFIRDMHLQKAESASIESNQEESLVTLAGWTHLNNDVEDRIEFVDAKIKQLENHIQELSEQHYEKGLSLFAENKPSKGIRKILQSLYLDPKSKKVRDKLYQVVRKPDYFKIKILANDTDRSIAKKAYNDISKAPIVAYYKDRQGNLAPGMELNLPNLPKKPKPPKNTKPSKPIISPKPPGKICGIQATDSRKELSGVFFEKGENYFRKNEILKAKQALQTSVCLDPDNAPAAELLKLLKGIIN